MSCFGYKSFDLLFLSKSATRLIYFNVNSALVKALDNKWYKERMFLSLLE